MQDGEMQPFTFIAGFLQGAFIWCMTASTSIAAVIGVKLSLQF